MDQLEDIAFRYLPRTLIEHWAENPDIRPVWGYWLNGSLMHCDVTGFTAMSEKLAEVGKEGAELMAGVLNQFFERMLAIAISWGGIQMKFGGDAMLIYFPKDNHAQRAAACGLEMQSAMREFSRVKVKSDYHKLLMRIGVHSGEFYVCSVGQVGTKIGQGEGLLHYYIVGSDVNKAADTEPMAEPGQVVVSDDTYQLIHDDENNKLLKTEHDGIWLVKKIKAKKYRLKYFDDDALPYHVLERYLMKPIAEGYSSGKSEHRRVTIIFIYVTGIAEQLKNANKDTGLSQLDDYTNMIIAAAEKYGGYFAASDASEHGDKLIVLFGAPVLQDSQESSAMNFALEIKNNKHNLNVNLRHHIGINTGYVFCGEIGSSNRREYTVIGDSVNLSARLMAAAKENEIIVSDYTARKVRDEFDLTDLEPIMVKGKKDPIPICRLDSINKESAETESFAKSQFFGRSDEMAMIKDIHSEIEGAESLLLVGEAGIGKTKIVYEYVRSMQDKASCTMLFCKSFNKNLAYSGIRKILLDISDCSEYGSQEENKEKIRELIVKYASEYMVFFPLLAEIIGFKEEGNEVTNSIDNKTKRDKRHEMISILLSNYSEEYKLISLIDNMQWIDSTSEEILSSVLSDPKSRLFLIGTSRSEKELERISNDLYNKVIKIESLSKADTEEILSKLLKNFDNSLVENVYEKTQGNPLFIIELIESGSLESGVIPDSLNDIVIAKMDKLMPAYRSLLQNVSVAGHNFRTDEITCL